MSKLKVILVDDERDSLDSLKIDIEEYCPQLEILGTFSDASRGLQAIRDLQPDLIFLDIEMPHMNGFELLGKLDSLEVSVIFVTAYDEYALKAFDFNAIDYLLKPVLKDKLILAVNKVLENANRKMNEQNLGALVHNIQMGANQAIERIAIPVNDGFEFVHINDIIYLQAESNYCWIHFANREKHLISKTLKDMTKMINRSQFLRAHQSYYVNLNHVKKYVRGGGGYLVLTNNTTIPVSRNQKENLKEKFGI